MRTILFWPSFRLLITIGFGVIVLASPNREIRFAFPAIVALPFLSVILLSGDGHPVPRRLAALAAGVVFFGLLAAGVPTGHRADRQSLIRADAVLAQAAECNANRILLATDSPTLNRELMLLAVAVSSPSVPFDTETLAYQVNLGVPIEQDFRMIGEADMVVFQDKEKLFPAFTNQRVPEYERRIRQSGYTLVRIMNDLSVYLLHCER